MIRKTYRLETITPCFCAGAEPDKAEIRAASIRGQLRWWFRVLGGFRSLAPLSLREQEDMIFGTVAGDSGCAGQLAVRTKVLSIRQSTKDAEALGHRQFSNGAYLAFPLQSRPNRSGARGVIDAAQFELTLLWKGSSSAVSDLQALITVFANLGSMGFRSRRAMGAIAPAGSSLPFSGWETHFNNPEAIVVKRMPAASPAEAISKLGGWLRQWRSHGRTQDHGANKGDVTQPPRNIGFKYAKNDHDIGYGLVAPPQPAYRPALGLPIIQRTSRATRNWNYGPANRQESQGRFASPVLLRPHRDASGGWHALVIFVDSRKWPVGRQVYLDGQPRAVSLDLYEAMKNDAPGLLTAYPS